MKKIIKILCLMLVFVLALSFAAACKDDEESINTFENDTAKFTYVYNKDKTGCIINGVESVLSDDVVIPEKIDDLPVVEIAKNSFKDKSSIKSVKIPASVKRIGESAFFGCSALTDITFAGTKAEWHKVNKGTNWSKGTSDLKVTCSDGEDTSFQTNMGTAETPDGWI